MTVDHVGVHATHCCERCGCKYSDPKCPVVSGEIAGLDYCEDCQDLLEETTQYVGRLTPNELTKLLVFIALLPKDEKDGLWKARNRHSY